MDCPRCKDIRYCKAGKVKCRQRYKSKTCNYYYTVAQKSDVKSSCTKRMAFEMYLEGLGFRAIGRILKISYGTVYQWVKRWSSNLE
jgi:transposase-like protein